MFARNQLKARHKTNQSTNGRHTLALHSFCAITPQHYPGSHSQEITL